MSMATKYIRQITNKLKMNLNKLTCLTAFLVLLLSTSKAQEVASYSLQEAIGYALEHNVDLKNAQLAHKSSDYEVGEILSIGLPQVSASVNVSSNIVVPKTPVPGEFFGGEPGSFAFVAFSPKHQGNLNVTLDQLIFDATYFLGLKAAKMLKQLTYKDVQLSEIAAIESVSKAYYNALIQEERVELFERQLGSIDTLLMETTAMYENGFAEKIDVNRIKVQYNNLKVEKERFDEIAKLSYDILKFQMGMPIENNIELTEDIENINFIEPSYDLANFSYDNRLEFTRLKTNEDLQQINIKNIRSGYYPNLKGFASVAGNAGSGQFGDVAAFDFSGADRTWFENVTVGVTLNVPIFDSFKKHNQIQKVRVQLMQIENQYDQLRNSIDLEIAQARVDLQSGVNNLNAQEENLALAREIFDVSKIKYQEGVGSNIEVVNATTTYKEAEINYYNALYDALIAKVDLQKSLGTLSR